MKKPLISVVTSVHNSERFVRTAVKSILEQTYSSFELVIVDDGSIDRTYSIVASFKDQRIRILRNHKKRGIAYSLNKAIRASIGNLIARMDADDIADYNRIESQVTYLNQNPQVGVVASAVELIDEKGKFIKTEPVPLDHPSILRTLAYRNPFRHSSVMIRRSLLDTYGLYDEKVEGAEDYDLWLRLAKHTEFGGLPTPLTHYRLTKSSVSFHAIARVERAYLRAKLKSIKEYGYPKWHYIFALKSLISQNVPLTIKNSVYQKFFHYK